VKSDSNNNVSILWVEIGKCVMVNINNTHWALAVVFPQLKQIHYFDSMGNGCEEYMSSLRQWVIDEA
jgi:Ulp1 family protease